MDATMNDRSHQQPQSQPAGAMNFNNTGSGCNIAIMNAGSVGQNHSTAGDNGDDAADAGDKVGSRSKNNAAASSTKEPPPDTGPKLGYRGLPLIGPNVIPEHEYQITIEHAKLHFASRWVFASDRNKHEKPWEHAGFPDKENLEQYMLELRTIRCEIQKEAKRANRKKVFANFAEHQFRVPNGMNVTKPEDVKLFIQSEGMKQLFFMCPILPFMIIWDLIYSTSTPSKLDNWLPDHIQEWTRALVKNPFDFEASVTVPKETTAKEYAEEQEKKKKRKTTTTSTNGVVLVAKESAREIFSSITTWEEEHFCDIHLGFRAAKEGSERRRDYHQIPVQELIGTGKNKAYLFAKKSEYPHLPKAPKYKDLCKDNRFAIKPYAQHAYMLARTAREMGLDKKAALDVLSEMWGRESALPVPKKVDAASTTAAISSLGGRAAIKNRVQGRLDRDDHKELIESLPSDSPHKVKALPVEPSNHNNIPNHTQGWVGHPHFPNQGWGAFGQQLPPWMQMQMSNYQTFLANASGHQMTMPPPLDRHQMTMPLPLDAAGESNLKDQPAKNGAGDPNIEDMPSGKPAASPATQKNPLDVAEFSPSTFFDVTDIMDTTPASSSPNGSFTPLPLTKNKVASKTQQKDMPGGRGKEFRSMIAAEGNAGAQSRSQAGKGSVLRLKRGFDPPKNSKADNSVTLHEEIEVEPKEVPNAVSTEVDEEVDLVAAKEKNGIINADIETANEDDAEEEQEDAQEKEEAGKTSGRMKGEVKEGGRGKKKKGRKKETNHNKKWEVEAILNVKEEEVTVGRGSKKGKSVRPLWFVKWKNFDDSENSWLSRECFADDASLNEADAMYTSFLEKKKVCSKEAMQSKFLERVQRLQQKAAGKTGNEEKAEEQATHFQKQAVQSQKQAVQSQTLSKPPPSATFFHCRHAVLSDVDCIATMCDRCAEHLKLHNRHYTEEAEEVREAREAGDADRMQAEEAATAAGSKKKVWREGSRKGARARNKTGETQPEYDVDANGCSHDNPAFWQKSTYRAHYLVSGVLSSTCHNCGYAV